MKNILEKIINDKKQSLELIKKDKSLDALEKNIKNQNFFNFKEAIQKNNGISIISEIKKASPSAGVLINNFNHLEIAKMYVCLLYTSTSPRDVEETRMPSSA